MIMQVFSVLDKAVGAYLPPVFARSRGEMLRSFSQAVNTPDHQFAKHSVDYTLFQIGTWDDNSGMFQPMEPQRILGAIEVLEEAGNFPESKRVS